MIADINTEIKAAGIMEIASDEAGYLNSLVDELECPDCRAFSGAYPTGASVRRVFDHLVANCRADAPRKK